jgi:hypothetical protein
VKVSASALLLALALIGCGSSNGSLPACVPTPQLVSAPPTMLAPQPGATGVTATGLSVTISLNPAGNGTLRLVDGIGTTVLGSAFGPPPAGSTQPAGSAVATLPNLAAHTSYTVFVDAVYPAANPCFSDTRSGPTTFQLGSFTTS